MQSYYLLRFDNEAFCFGENNLENENRIVKKWLFLRPKFLTK